MSHEAEAAAYLKVAENVTNQTLRTEYLTKALIHSNLALAAAMNSRRNK